MKKAGHLPCLRFYWLPFQIFESHAVLKWIFSCGENALWHAGDLREVHGFRRKGVII